MAFAVKKLPDEPIVIVTVDLPVHEYEQNFKSLSTQLDQLVSSLASPLYTILDVRSLDVAFSDILLLIDLSREFPSGLLADGRMIWILVGEHPLLPIAIRRLAQQLGGEFLTFEAIEDTLAFIRDQLDQ